MRSSAAFLAMAAALAACGSRPGSPPAAGGAAERAPAPPAPAAPAIAPPPAPIPRGDRHARAAARRSRVVKRVEGILADRDDRTVVVGRPGAPALTLRISPGTSVTLDGRPARADALPPGAEVRAAYRTGDGGRPTALSVEARRPAGAAPAARGAGDADRPAADEAAGAVPWEASPEPAEPGGG